MADRGRLVVCATPIGNLGDISDRLRRTLAGADVIYAEDTRRTAKLLAHIGVSVPLRSLFVGNETERTAELLADLASGRIVALVTDAGTPLVSDPGVEAVRGARLAGHEVTVVPGPSAVTAALALAGFGGDRFVFEGFLPRRGQERRRRLESIAIEDRPVVLFVSPHRVGSDLTDLAEAIGEEREICLLREMTKIHEEVWAGSLGEARHRWTEARGELTVVIGPAAATKPDLGEAVEEARVMVAGGVPPSEAARRVASSRGVSRRALYQALLDQGRS